MELHEVSGETFKSIKELAEIQSQITNGRAELHKLKTKHEEYLAAREKEATERVSQALRESQEALREADENRSTLTSYLANAKELVSSIKDLGDSVTESAKYIEKTVDEFDTSMEEKIEKIATIRNELHVAKIAIESDRNTLETQKRLFAEEKKRILDIMHTTNRKIERLKAGKI